MARIRSIKPEFWDDRKLARSTSRDGRLLYMAMWNQADEHGRLNGDTVWLKGRAFPYDDDLGPDQITQLLDELEAATRIQRYEVDGDPFIFLPKLDKHQRLEAAKVESRLPEPPARTETSTDANQPAPRADRSVPDAKSSTLLYGAGSREQGASSRGQVGPRGTRIPDDWTPDPDLIDAMRAEGIPDALARRELPRFRDYWTAKSGRDATKVDWPATWRNWLRRAADESPPGAVNGAGKATNKAAGWLAIGNDQAAIGGRSA